MITSLEIENFKSIGQTSKVDFSDITLLYGPNSAGKSSVIQALHYLREVLCHENPDPKHSTVDSDVHLGGFRSLVHRRDGDKRIRLKCTFQCNPHFFDSLRIPHFFEEFRRHDQMPLLPNFEKHMRQVSEAVRDERQVSYDFPEHVAIGPIPLKRLPARATISILVGINDSPSPKVLEVGCEIDGQRVVTLQHVLDGTCRVHVEKGLLSLLPDFDHDFVEWRAEKQSVFSDDPLYESTQFATFANRGSIEPQDVLNPLDLDQDGLLPFFRLDLREKTDSILAKEQVLVDSWSAIKAAAESGQQKWTELAGLLPERSFSTIYETYGSSNGCFPVAGWWYEKHADYDEWPHLSDEHFGEMRDTAENRAIGTACVYGQVIALMLQEQLRQHLDGLLHIGPLRDHYDSEAPRSARAATWYKGLGAWDALAFDEDLCDATSLWLSSKERFDTPYRVRVRRSRRIMEGDRVHKLLSAGASSDAVREAIDQIRPDRHAMLVDTAHGIELKSSDVGTGISQILPILVAALASKTRFAVFEQPELHLHPKAQLAIADLLIHATSTSCSPRKQFLIETHSEHLALRLLRRIRETADGELGDEDLRLLPAKVAINYLLPASEGVMISRLRVDESGEFIDRWPRGFFDERAEELF